MHTFIRKSEAAKPPPETETAPETQDHTHHHQQQQHHQREHFIAICFTFRVFVVCKEFVRAYAKNQENWLFDATVHINWGGGDMCEWVVWVHDFVCIVYAQHLWTKKTKFTHTQRLAYSSEQREMHQKNLTDIKCMQNTRRQTMQHLANVHFKNRCFWHGIFDSYLYLRAHCMY